MIAHGLFLFAFFIVLVAMGLVGEIFGFRVLVCSKLDEHLYKSSSVVVATYVATSWVMGLLGVHLLRLHFTGNLVSRPDRTTRFRLDTRSVRKRESSPSHSPNTLILFRHVFCNEPENHVSNGNLRECSHLFISSAIAAKLLPRSEVRLFRRRAALRGRS